MTAPGEITRLLASARDGDAEAMTQVVPLVYHELLLAARRQLRREREGHTLDSAALVHEAWMKLAPLRNIQWHDRVHFLAVAARLMRQVLLTHAERRGAAKRGADAAPITLHDRMVAAVPTRVAYADLEDALRRLESRSPRQCRVVECRFFAGLDITETAAALGVSEATVKRDWTLARAWLNRELA